MHEQNDNSFLPPQNQADVTTITLLECLKILIQNRMMLFKVIFLSLIISVIVSLVLPKIYSSTTRIIPPQQDNGLMGMMMGAMGGGLSGIAGDLLGKGTTADLYVGILNSEAIKDTIIDRFKLMDVYGNKYRLDTYKTLDDKIDISAGKKDGIISITVEDKNPVRASEIANAYVEELGKLTVKLSSTGASQNKAFIEDRLAKARAELTKAEDALKFFQKKNKSLDLTEQAKGTIKGIADMTAMLAAEEVKLAAMQRTLTESSQEVKNQKAVIINLKSQITQFEGSQKSGAIPSIGSVPALGQEYVRLMRNFKIQETLVELLTKQYELSALSEAKNISGVQIIQTAKAPDKKIKPKRSVVVMMTTFGSFLFAVIYILTREFIKRIPDEKVNQWRNMLLKNKN